MPQGASSTSSSMEGSSRIGTSLRFHKGGGMKKDGVMDITVGNKEDGEFGSVQGSSFSRTSNRSSYDDDDDDNPASLSHEEAVRREKARIVQRRLYSRGKGFPYSVDLANSVKRILKEKIFPKIKLLSDTESQYMTPDFVGLAVDQSRNICDVLVRELKLPNELEDKISFWITYRSLVKKQLVKFRSNCVEELKKQYFKVKEMMEADDVDAQTNDPYFNGCKELVTMLERTGSSEDSSIIALRENDDDNVKEAFFFFAREFLPCIVKRLVFKQFKLVKLLSDFVTISDEAFTLLLLENNIARWNAMFAANTNKADDTMPTQKFQAMPNDQQRSGGAKDGYSLKAAKRYMEYFDYVEEARMNVARDSLEMELLRRMEDLDTGKNRGAKGRRKRDGELNYFKEDGKPMRIRYEAL